jgi:hypothetical protein
MQKLLILSLLTALCLHRAQAGTIHGKITDARSGEPLNGITVALAPSHKTVFTGLDGSYTFHDIPQGSYTLTVSGVSYDVVSIAIEVTGVTLIKDLAMSPTQKLLEQATVVVGRTSGATDASARQLEKMSDNVVNILSTHQLQLMPDVTVANVLRRVSGVTVDRGDNGEGRYPVIRGMDKRYNYTLVNGIKIPSPDDKNRYVPRICSPPKCCSGSRSSNRSRPIWKATPSAA